MFRSYGFAAAALLLAGVHVVRADDAADVRAAAKRYFADLGHTTPQQILAQTDGYRLERPAVLAMDAMGRGQAKFTEACVRRFGNPPDARKMAFSYQARAAASIDAAAVTIRGTHASIHDPGQKPSEGVRFEKVADVWKFHCSTYPHTSDRDVELTVAAAQGFNDTAAEVEAGVHPNIASAVRACSARLMRPTVELLFGSDLFNDTPPAPPSPAR